MGGASLRMAITAPLFGMIGIAAAVISSSSAQAQTTITAADGRYPGTSSAGVTTPGTLSAAIAEVNAGEAMDLPIQSKSPGPLR